MPPRVSVNNSHNSASDIAEILLLQKVSQGDREAYTQLYQQHIQKLHAYIFRFTKQSTEQTEEIVQEVFLSIWEKKETLIAIQSFENYLFRIAKNKLLNLIKHEEYKIKLHHNFGLTQDKAYSNIDNNLQYSAYLKTAMQAIEKLPQKRKMIFLLSSQQGLSLDEIAEKMKISRSMVKKQLYAARLHIKNYLINKAEWLIAILIITKWE